MKTIDQMFSDFSFGINRVDWEEYAENISLKSDEELEPFLFRMLDWLESFETPGFLKIYHRLQNFSKTILEEKLKDKIKLALSEKKYMWCLWMTDLLGSDSEREKILEEIRILDARFSILDMLDCENDIDTQKLGIELGIKEENFDIFIQPFTPQYGQNVWENCAKILYNKSDQELEGFIPKLMMWLQDLNWYGATLILERLQQCSITILNKYLKECINIAIKQKDSNWLYGLEQLIADVDEKNRIESIVIDIEIDHEEEFYLNRKDITLDSKYINEYLNDLNINYLKIGALSALQKVGDDSVKDIFIPLRDDSEEHIRRIAEKALEKMDN